MTYFSAILNERGALFRDASLKSFKECAIWQRTYVVYPYFESPAIYIKSGEAATSVGFNPLFALSQIECVTWHRLIPA